MDITEPQALSLKSMPRDFPGGPVVKKMPCNAGDTGLMPEWQLRFHMHLCYVTSVVSNFL